MPSKIATILLIPHDIALLADGPCGARPPMAVRRTYPRVEHVSNRWGDPTYDGEKCEACGQAWPCDTPGAVDAEERVRWSAANHYTSTTTALVLAWGGTPLHTTTPWLPPRNNQAVWSAAAGLRGEGWARLRKECADLGTLVFLDADDREVTQ